MLPRKICGKTPITRIKDNVYLTFNDTGGRAKMQLPACALCTFQCPSIGFFHAHDSGSIIFDRLSILTTLLFAAISGS